MYSSRPDRVPQASTMAFRSPSCTLPLRMWVRLTRASAHRMRCTSWPALISKEKKVTAVPAFAAFTARFSAKEVFPTPGRAARITRSPPRNPWNRSSTSRKPVGTPAKLFFWAMSSTSSS